MPKVGTVLEGKYEITRLVGEGGMGAVYEAQHLVIGRKVAIKFLHAQFTENPQAIQRFIQEAQIAGALGHANICEVTDIGRSPQGEPYMIMPMLEGCSLADEMNTHKNGLPSERVFDIIYQVLTALQRAHGEGIVHRDLKPENIFLTRMGDRADFVKILDFGISKVLSATGPGVGGLTSTGMVLGTPYYMAPEQARGAKQIDHRVDIYAVGVILYELLTGSRPFEADSYNEIIVKIVTEPFIPPRAIRSDIPKAVEDVILKAMARSPEERFASVREFRHALLDRARDSALQLPRYLTRIEFTDEVDLIDPAELGIGGWRDRRRPWIFAGVGVAAALVLGVLLLWKPWAGKPGRPAKATPPATAAATDDPAARPGARSPGGAARDTASASPAAKPVTLRFLGLPTAGTILLDGKPVLGSSATVPRSSTRLRFQASAPGGLLHEGWVTPDQDRTMLLSLSQARSTASADPGAKRPGASRARPRTAAQASMTPGIRRPLARAAAGTMPHPMTVIRGRGGTELDGDYGD